MSPHLGLRIGLRNSHSSNVKYERYHVTSPELSKPVQKTPEHFGSSTFVLTQAEPNTRNEWESRHSFDILGSGLVACCRTEPKGASTSLPRQRLRNGRRLIANRETVWFWAISVARANVVLLQALACELHLDGPPSAIRILLGVIAERIKMR